MPYALFVALLSLVPGAAMAQSAQPPVSDDRFQIERQGDAFIRLDKKTGTVSTCTLENGSFDCRMSADERAALQAEIERLASENEQMKTASGQPETGVAKGGKELTIKLPTEAEIKGAISYIEEMLRRLVDAVKSLGQSA
jgi:hypothetical protein